MSQYLPINFIIEPTCRSLMHVKDNRRGYVIRERRWSERRRLRKHFRKWAHKATRAIRKYQNIVRADIPEFVSAVSRLHTPRSAVPYPGDDDAKLGAAIKNLRDYRLGKSMKARARMTIRNTAIAI
jgi:hypothetical protein